MGSKTLLIGILVVLAVLCGSVYTGEMEAILDDDTSDVGFSIKDDGNDVIARFRGDGNE